ncbi:MAG: primosomal protein N' [Spirochaetia bacterium]|nr:primosomal protein N' [Spirochaetia bacterium]
MIAGVYINSYYRESIDCFVPENLRSKIGIFQRVYIKKGPEKIIGIVGSIAENTMSRDTSNLLRITHVVDRDPVINQEQFELSLRVAEHYLCTRSDVIFSMIPSGKREKITHSLGEITSVPLPVLNEDQNRIFQKIIQMPAHNTSSAVTDNLGKVNVHLIHGITGSGKTRIYIELIREYLKKQLGVIFLIPEIALSYQFLETFKPVFGDQMAILHSGLSRSFRFSEYKRVLKDQARLVIGTRSAVFAPVKDLGLVIIDEEHDSSFKEHTSTKYHAKWVASDRLRHKTSWPFKLSLSLVLGSATPAIESMYYAQKNIFMLHELKKRATGQLLPQIYIPLHMPADDGADVLSPFLVRKMEEHLKRGNQVILILNRRGYNNCAFCNVCEQNVMCPHCSVSLTYHRLDSNSGSDGKNVLKCHLCGYHESYRTLCKECGTKLKLLGKGIQKVEDALEFHFPKYVYARMDQDSVSAKGYAEDIISAMITRKIDILIGTQMIAKGFDLPGVTLVGLLNTDIGLSLPDFRASERVFQLLVQATGRAGRHSAGEVVMQTMQPGHYAVSAASESDYKTFYERELKLRHKMNYPPFCRLLRIVFRSKNEDTLWHFVNRLKMHIQEISSENSLFDRQTNKNLPSEILGPIEASLYKINNEFRVHILVKDQSIEHLKDFGKNIKNYYTSQRRKFEGLIADFDLDPLDVL